MYFHKITGQINKEDFDKNYKQDFQQLINSVANYYSEKLPFINEYDENLMVVEKISSIHGIKIKPASFSPPLPKAELFAAIHFILPPHNGMRKNQGLILSITIK